jgi:hypothetical protein
VPDIFTSQPTASAPKPSSSLRSMSSGIRQAVSSFMYLPQGMRFETQQEDEKIILFLRRHWVTNTGWIFLSLLLIFLPFFLFPYILVSGIVPNELVIRYLSFITLVWYLITSTFILSNFLMWYFNVVIVTNERVIDIDFINLLNKKLAETRIARIEDVSMHTGGIIRAFFDYGDVIVQTAASKQEFFFNSVPKPDQVVSVINQLMETEEEEMEENPA